MFLRGRDRPKDWSKVITDSSAVGDEKRATAGRVARHGDGKWTWGFAANIGIMDVDQLELQAIKMGLTIDWSLRKKNLKFLLCSSRRF